MVKRAEARAVAGGSPIERVVVAERPPLTLLARSGDPRGAIAFVAAHARGSALSLGLTAVLRARLEAQGVSGLEARAHGLGFELARAVDNEADVARFVTTLHQALAQPIRAGDPVLGRAQREVEVLRALSFDGPGEAAVSACSGELGFERGAPSKDFASDKDIAELDATRAAAFRVGAAAFSALGAAQLLDAATRAVSSDAAWPSGAADTDPWPEADALFVDKTSGPRRLSLAIRAPNADAALGAGFTLASAGSPLAERLGALNPPWRLERTSAVARLRGACLRLDLTPPPGDPAPNAEEIARAAAVAETSINEALASSEPGAVDESVLRPSNPLKAASLAAWRALLGPEESLPSRTTVAYSGESADAVQPSELTRALTALRARASQASFELSSRAEAGQGELWMLLASSCGTVGEGAIDAGAIGLSLRAMALRSGDSDVQLEPWVTPDGAGLLAHAPRRRPSESAREQAERVATALGRAVGLRLNGSEVGSARTQLLNELGGRPFAGWSALLDGLAPGHSSWIEARGSWLSVSELSTDELERTRRYFLSGPLKLSVLASRGDTQAPAATQVIESWLLPTRATISQCPAARAEAPRHGESRLVQSGSSPEGAYVGVVFADAGAAGAHAAELTELVLNQPRGLLSRALSQRCPGASATARVLGGFRRPALVVEVRALPEQLNDALNAVRGALDELGRGQLTSEQFSWATARLAEREATAAFDPRRRIVDLFRGSRPLETDVAALRAAQNALTMSSHWVVSLARAP